MTKESISNPLTIVGIFAGIAEVAGTTVIPFLSRELQALFIWYVMGFPIFLVILFFITWNFNPKVLYSPSDYQNEDNFLTILTKTYKSKMENDINELEVLIEGAKKDIVEETVKAMSNKSVHSQGYIENVINSKMTEVYTKLDETKNNTSEYADLTIKFTSSVLQRRIIDVISECNEIGLTELATKMEMSMASLSLSLKRLVERNIITSERRGRAKVYKINEKYKANL